MEFSFHIFDMENWETIVDSETIRIETSCFGSYSQEYDDSRDIIYEDTNIKIVSKGVEEDEIWGMRWRLYIENNFSDNLTIQVRGLFINGFKMLMMDSFSPDIVAGKKALRDITFLESDI